MGICWGEKLGGDESQGQYAKGLKEGLGQNGGGGGAYLGSRRRILSFRRTGLGFVLALGRRGVFCRRGFLEEVRCEKRGERA